MGLSEAEARLIAAFARSAATASSMESVVSELFRTLRMMGTVESIELVYPFDYARWDTWRMSGESPSMTRTDEWPTPPKNAMTTFFDPDNRQAGYVSLPGNASKTGYALETLAPIVWTAMSLQTALARVQKASRSETEMVRTTLRARDEERQRIARELHDDLGQSMASLKLSLKWAEDIARKQKGMEPVVDELSESRDAVGVMLGKIRDLSHTLYPKILDTLGLFAAVKEMTLQVSRHSSIQVTCTCKGKPRALDMEIGVALYRCCQESISNVLRHSGASRLAIQVRYSGKDVSLAVEDDGRGFDPRPLYDSGGKRMSSGFWTIRQRMADLGGSFRLSTAEGMGTVVEMTVPYSSNHKNANKRKNKTAHRR